MSHHDVVMLTSGHLATICSGIVMLCPSVYARLLTGALEYDQAKKKGEGR